MASEPRVKPGVLGQRRPHFAWLRTRLAVERTLLSWVRTGAALIGFGFTMFQFFERLKAMENVAPAEYPGLTRTVSLALIAVGTGAVFVALVQYRAMLRYLWSPEFGAIAGVGERPGWTPGFLVALALALIGMFVLLVLLARLGAAA